MGIKTEIKIYSKDGSEVRSREREVRPGASLRGYAPGGRTTPGLYYVTHPSEIISGHPKDGQTTTREFFHGDEITELQLTRVGQTFPLRRKKVTVIKYEEPNS